MNPTASRAALLPVLLFFLDATTLAEDGEATDVLRTDWLAKDVANVNRLRALLKDPVMEVDSFVEKLDGAIHDDRDLGFGGRFVSVAVYGGYTTCWFKVVAFKGKIVGYELLNDFDSDDFEGVRNKIKEAWAGFGKVGERGVIYTYHSKDRLESFRTSIAEVLGRQIEVEVPAALREAYALLSDPLCSLDFGRVCFFAGVKPDGRVAIEKFDVEEHLDLIRNILRGPNPVGRVYAAEVLISHETAGKGLSAEDRETVSKIRPLKIPIRTCDGCEVEDRMASEILDGLRAR